MSIDVQGDNLAPLRHDEDLELGLSRGPNDPAEVEQVDLVNDLLVEIGDVQLGGSEIWKEHGQVETRWSDDGAEVWEVKLGQFLGSLIREFRRLLVRMEVWPSHQVPAQPEPPKVHSNTHTVITACIIAHGAGRRS